MATSAQRGDKKRARAKAVTDVDPEVTLPDEDATLTDGDVYLHDLAKQTAVSPELSGGDVDAAWDKADSGEETVGGTAPTPDQDVVDELGEAVGLTFNEEEPIRTEKVEERDVERWELDPASSEDYEERTRELNPKRRSSRPA